MAKNYIGGRKVELVDIGGSFARFLKEAPRIARASLHEAVKQTAFSLSRRMMAGAAVSGDEYAPHMRDAITYEAKGMRAEVGFINATEPAAPGSNASIADVALYNEYRPNRQPFMRPAAEAESSDFMRRVSVAIQQMERTLSSGTGI